MRYNRNNNEREDMNIFKHIAHKVKTYILVMVCGERDTAKYEGAEHILRVIIHRCLFQKHLISDLMAPFGGHTPKGFKDGRRGAFDEIEDLVRRMTDELGLDLSEINDSNDSEPQNKDGLAPDYADADGTWTDLGCNIEGWYDGERFEFVRDKSTKEMVRLIYHGLRQGMDNNNERDDDDKDKNSTDIGKRNEDHV